MNPDRLDTLFLALASAHRRRMLDLIVEMPGCSVNDVSKHFDMTRIAVMKHLNVLEEADLIVSERNGRRREMYFNAVPLQLVHDRWTDAYSRFWAGRTVDLKRAAEADAAAPEPEPQEASRRD